MFKRFALLVLLTSLTWAQPAFQPHDEDEAQAYKIYLEYRQCKARESALEQALKQKFGDALMGVAGNYGILGVDREALGEAKSCRGELDQLRLQEEQLISAWDQKYYWRYGDLRWSNDSLKDPKTGRTMDRIEFALNYFRFRRSASNTAAANQPSSVTAHKGNSESWAHVQVGLSNVSQFQTKDMAGWRNNGTQFSAIPNAATVPVQIRVETKGNVSYEDYRASVSVFSGRKTLLSEQSIISKNGGSKSYSLTWRPSQDGGPLEIKVSVTGGNPESFTYYVNGNVLSSVPPAKIETTPTSTTIFGNGNDMAVGNGGRPAIVELSKATRLTQIVHYHWNGGQGAPAGTITLKHASGTTYGPWQTTLRNGVYWDMNTPVSLPAGRYTVIDSDPATWSQNSGSAGQGIVIWKGHPEP